MSVLVPGGELPLLFLLKMILSISVMPALSYIGIFFLRMRPEEVADIKEYVEDAGIYYNSLGVDPVSGEVYFATLKGYADYKTNDIAIFDFNKTPALQFDIKNKNKFSGRSFLYGEF